LASQGINLVAEVNIDIRLSYQNIKNVENKNIEMEETNICS
jgi:hypothetical protein